MQILTILAALATITGIILLFVLRPKHENYVTLRNIGRFQGIGNLTNPEVTSTMDGDDNEYTDRPGYVHSKRRYNFLNRKNTLYNG